MTFSREHTFSIIIRFLEPVCSKESVLLLLVALRFCVRPWKIRFENLQASKYESKRARGKSTMVEYSYDNVKFCPYYAMILWTWYFDGLSLWNYDYVWKQYYICPCFAFSFVLLRPFRPLCYRKQTLLFAIWQLHLLIDKRAACFLPWILFEVIMLDNLYVCWGPPKAKASIQLTNPTLPSIAFLNHISIDTIQIHIADQKITSLRIHLCWQTTHSRTRPCCAQDASASSQNHDSTFAGPHVSNNHPPLSLRWTFPKRDSSKYLILSH